LDKERSEIVKCVSRDKSRKVGGSKEEGVRKGESEGQKVKVRCVRGAVGKKGGRGKEEGVLGKIGGSEVGGCGGVGRG